MVVLFAGEIGFCAGSIIIAFYQRQYNRRLAEAGLGINRWFLSERTFNYLTAVAMLLIGWYLITIPITESRSGLATGGLFFENHRFADEPNLYWQLIYFHFALGVLPLVGGAWLLLFQPKKSHSIENKLNYYVRL